MAILKNHMADKFTQLPNSLITDKEISHGAFRVAAYLFSRPADWEINNTDVRKQLGISRAETIAKYWKELTEAGWLTREAKKAGANGAGGYDYSLNVEKSEYGKTVSAKSVSAKPRHAENRTLNNTETTTNTDINNTKHTKDAHSCAKVKKKNGDQALIESCKFEGVDQEIIKDYLVYRRSIRKPIKTARGLQTQINTLASLSPDSQREALNNTINNEWMKIVPVNARWSNQTDPNARYENIPEWARSKGSE